MSDLICTLQHSAPAQNKYKMKQIDKKIVINLNAFLGVRTFMAGKGSRNHLSQLKLSSISKGTLLLGF